MQVKRACTSLNISDNSLILEIIYSSLLYHNSRMCYVSFFLCIACLLEIWKNMKRAGYNLNKVGTCLLPQDPVA